MLLHHCCLQTVLLRAFHEECSSRSVGFHLAPGGGVCAGSSLQETKRSWAAAAGWTWTSSAFVFYLLMLTPPLTALWRRCASVWFSVRVSSSVLLLSGDKKNNFLCNNWIQVRKLFSSQVPTSFKLDFFHHELKHCSITVHCALCEWF